MTLTELVTAVRRKYNSVGDSFYADGEICNLIYEASCELANEALMIPGIDTSITTVASTQSYDFPTRFLAIKRVLWKGQKLSVIDFKLDDILTLSNAITADTGTPQYYWTFNNKIYLRPTPATAEVITIYGYKEPGLLDETTDALEIPTQFHLALGNYAVSEMAAKDENFTAASYYLAKWEKAKEKAIQWNRRQYIQDNFKVVKDEESGSYNILGPL